MSRKPEHFLRCPLPGNSTAHHHPECHSYREYNQARPPYTLDQGKTVLPACISLIGLGLMALGLGLALTMKVCDLFDLSLFRYTIFTCGLAVPVIVGFHREKLVVTPRAALATSIDGKVVGLLGKLPVPEIPRKEELRPIGFAASAPLPLRVSLLDANRPSP